MARHNRNNQNQIPLFPTNDGPLSSTIQEFHKDTRDRAADVAKDGLQRFDSGEDPVEVGQLLKLLKVGAYASVRAMVENGDATPEQLEKTARAVASVQRMEYGQEDREIDRQIKIAKRDEQRAQAKLKQREAGGMGKPDLTDAFNPARLAPDKK